MWEIVVLFSGIIFSPSSLSSLSSLFLSPPQYTKILTIIDDVVVEKEWLYD
jgi:hypothetical protein